MFDFKSISKANLISWLATILLVSGFFIIFFIYEKSYDFNKSAESLHKSFVYYCKQNISSEVDNAIKYIEHERTLVPKDTSDADTKKIILKRLRDIKFGRSVSGDVFVMDQKGNIQMHPESSYEGKNIAKTIGAGGERLLDWVLSGASYNAGRYISFDASDASNPVPVQTWVYTQAYPNYGWIVCSKIREDEMKKTFGENQNRLKVDMTLEIGFMLVLSLLVTVAAIIFSLGVSSVIKGEINFLVNYFNECFKKHIVLGDSDFRFDEFRFIGFSAASMVTQIKELIQRVKNLAIKAEMNNQIKTAYLNSMSHQFRNPVNGVVGMTQLLMDTKLTDEQKNFVKAIEISGNSLVELIGDIDDFANMESGGVEIEKAPFDLRGTSEEVILMVNKQASEKNLKVGLDIEKDVPKYLMGDPERIKQILTVLCRNAIVFTTEGGVKINIAAAEKKDKNIQIVFKVTDTGLGISAEKLSDIFDFTHEEYSKSKKFAAVSLGLSVCKHLTETMSGKISVESEKGRGTVFTVMLPLEIIELNKVEEDILKKAGASVPHNFAGMKVLVAEDDPVNRNVALKLMSKLGVSVDTAVNGEEAIKKLNAGKYDMVFMDCEMPVMDGFTATKNIRKKEAEDKTRHRIPIVAMTAYAMRGDKEMCLEAGMDDHIAKPVTKEVLLRTLEKYLGTPK
ncbi:MAG TPA: hypothetical protein DCZ94_10190 [Lentisphaeria bacterium]|nr:MAG: hypothetical protein A2X48_11065 [Lentisphaerae bacterium GWF2_49_21]HBC87313.1 hypothetical protein [Lentisphaeria bacterium]